MLNAFFTGKFSSDRTIQEYATDIWKVKPFELPAPASSVKGRSQSFHDSQGNKTNKKN